MIRTSLKRDSGYTMSNLSKIKCMEILDKLLLDFTESDISKLTGIDRQRLYNPAFCGKNIFQPIVKLKSDIDLYGIEAIKERLSKI